MKKTILFILLVLLMHIQVGLLLETKKCKVTRALYERFMGASKSSITATGVKECLEPGCFSIYDQKNLGLQWELPAYLKDKEPILMGCRYDIPYLIQRTYGGADKKLHRALKMLRACFVSSDKNRTASFCQPEYAATSSAAPAPKDAGTTSTHSQRQMAPMMGRNKGINWAKHMASVQNQCFYKFASGVFFVSDDEGDNNMVVCCSDGHDNDKATTDFSDTCQKTTEAINNVAAWRKDF